MNVPHPYPFQEQVWDKTEEGIAGDETDAGIYAAAEEGLRDSANLIQVSGASAGMEMREQEYAPASAINRKISGQPVLPLLWILGMVICMAVAGCGYFRESRMLRQALPVSKRERARIRAGCIDSKVPVLVFDQIATPLTAGIWKSRIILPKSLLQADSEQISCVMLHELVHIRRHDNLRKLFCLIICCVHWFNPLVWVMYLFFDRDMELSCDEAVVRFLGTEKRQNYALALISQAESCRRTSLFCSGFGKNAVQERIVSIMRYKKARTQGLLCAVCILMMSVMAFAKAVPESSGEDGKPAAGAAQTERINKAPETESMAAAAGLESLRKKNDNSMPGNTEPEQTDSADMAFRRMYAAAEVNLRAGADADAEILTVIGTGEQVEITGAETNGWIPVRFRGISGYSSPDYLTEERIETPETEANDPAVMETGENTGANGAAGNAAVPGNTGTVGSMNTPDNAGTAGNTGTEDGAGMTDGTGESESYLASFASDAIKQQSQMFQSDGVYESKSAPVNYAHGTITWRLSLIHI